MPDEFDDFDDGISSTTPTSPSPPASVPAAASSVAQPVSASTSVAPASLPSASTATPAVATTAEPAPAGVAQPAPVSFSALARLKELGADVSHFRDDEAAVNGLLTEVGRYHQALAAARQEAAQVAALRAELAAMKAAQQKPAGEEKPWWPKPEYNPAWQGMVRRNEDGVLVDAPGAPAGTAEKVKQYYQRRNEVMDQLVSDPLGMIQPGLEKFVDERMQRVLEQRFGQQAEVNYANNIIQQNSKWLFVHDAAGQVVTNPMTGGMMPTPDGQQYFQSLKHAAQMQMPQQAQHQYAVAQVMAARAQAILAGQQPANGNGATAAATNEQLKNQYIGGAAHVPSQAGSTIAPSNPNAASSQNPKLTIRQRLEANLPDGISM